MKRDDECRQWDGEYFRNIRRATHDEAALCSLRRDRVRAGRKSPTVRFISTACCTLSKVDLRREYRWGDLRRRT